MKIIIKAVLAFLFLFQSAEIFSQKRITYKFDKITQPDFVIPSALVDSNTNAVIIADVGNTEFEGNNKGWFTYVYKKRTRIKIINKKAFDLASVNIMLYQDKDDRESPEDISGTTFNLVNGNVVTAKLEKKDIFQEKYDKNHYNIRFTLPAVTEGSIIEYTYTIKSNFIFNIPSWEFQNASYPTLWNEYNIAIPSLLTYMSIRYGKHSFFIDQADQINRNFSVTRQNESNMVMPTQDLIVSATVNRHKWVMKDIQGLKNEDYISSPDNFIDKISFQLYQTNNGQDTHDVYNSWNKVVDEMLKRSDFGAALNENKEELKDLAKTIVNPNDDQLKQLRDIFYYVQKNFTCTNTHRIFITGTLKDVIKKRAGNVGEINLLLTGLLQQIFIPADPVMLSTRNNGRVFTKYPQLDQYNYIICRIRIQNTYYYLDAAEPLLGFARLPLKCYNGFAKVISEDSAVAHLDADTLREKRTVSVFIINDQKEGYTGRITKDYGYYESLDTRHFIAGHSLSDFEKKITNEISQENMHVKNITIDSLDKIELPVSVKYDLDINLNGNEDIIYFNPLLDEAIKKNPFAAAERENPVEMPYITDDLYLLNMEVPDGYKIDELPKQVKLNLNGTDGSFEYLISVESNVIQFRCRLKINRANFESDSYQNLRDFYAYVVKKEAENIVFRKIKK